MSKCRKYGDMHKIPRKFILYLNGEPIGTMGFVGFNCRCLIVPMDITYKPTMLRIFDVFNFIDMKCFEIQDLKGWLK